MQAPCLPVKNTFIHFGAPQQSGGRSLRRWRTDPEEPVAPSLCSLRLDVASANSSALDSDSCSTTQPPSEVDILEARTDACASFDLDRLTCGTPEHTPRHSQDPWASPESTSTPSWPPAQPQEPWASPESTSVPAWPQPSQQEPWSFPQSPDGAAWPPAHLQEPWALPESPSPPMWPPTKTPPATLPCTPHVARVPTTPASMSSHSTQSSLSSSPVSTTFLDAAFNSLTNGQPPTSLDGAFCFDFTLRLADDVGLGVDLAPFVDDSQALVIKGVLRDGAMAAWNKQCYDGTSKRLKSIWPGDAIVSVNGKTEQFDMLKECQTKMLLKLTAYRSMGGVGPSGSAMPTDCGMFHVPSARGPFQTGGRQGVRLCSAKKHAVL